MYINEFRQKIDLGGKWLYRINGGEYTERTVPGSYHCVGNSEYMRRFSVNKAEHRRTVLTFEGINYEGTIILNGTELGKTLPYCHYSFDITSLIRDVNELTVLVKDINAPYGPTDGWCCYGGIIRAVYLEILPETYISDVFFRQSLSEDLATAEVEINVSTLGNSDNGYSLHAELCRCGRTVVTSDGGKLLRFTVDSPDLWSPDTPQLYELCLYLIKDGKATDKYSMSVGFRTLCMDGKRFYLNGKPFFIAGVCRHDLGEDEKGQTLSDEDIIRDLKMIKELGANFVRLVHYPHDKRVIEFADRLGLFVSEESGLWWSDMSNKTLTDGALEVLKKTITRDRSNTSVAFWMGFNECIFTQEFLCDSVKVCRELDPDRYVSGANCMNPEMTREMFGKADIDFYTFHPYGTDINSVTSGTKSAKNGPSNINDIFRAFAGKPLVFTEWGGWNVVDNPALFMRFCNRMKKARDDGMLAGMIYWSFADMYEFNRGQGACIDGIQTEGLVTIDRKPKINYYTYQKFLRELSEKEEPRFLMSADNTCGTDYTDTAPIPLCRPDSEPAQKEAWDAATKDSAVCRGRFMMRKNRTIQYGPCLPDKLCTVGSIDFDALCKPIAINEIFPSFTFNVGMRGKKLLILGNVLYALGIPIYGEYGEVCAELRMKYTDGSEYTRELRNGIELLTVMTTYGSSIIDPSSPSLKNAVTFSYDRNFENYRIYLLETELVSDKELKSVTIESKMPERTVLLYGASIAL